MGEIIIYDNFAKCASSIWFALRVHGIIDKIKQEMGKPHETI